MCVDGEWSINPALDWSASPSNKLVLTLIKETFSREELSDLLPATVLHAMTEPLVQPGLLCCYPTNDTPCRTQRRALK